MLQHNHINRLIEIEIPPTTGALGACAHLLRMCACYFRDDEGEMLAGFRTLVPPRDLFPHERPVLAKCIEPIYQVGMSTCARSLALCARLFVRVH